MKPTNVTINVNGRPRGRYRLDENSHDLTVYIENEEYARKEAEGLTAEENRALVLVRSILAYNHAIFQAIIDLEDIDPDAAAEVRETLGIAFTLDD